MNRHRISIELSDTISRISAVDCLIAKRKALTGLNRGKSFFDRILRLFFDEIVYFLNLVFETQHIQEFAYDEYKSRKSYQNR